MLNSPGSLLVLGEWLAENHGSQIQALAGPGLACSSLYNLDLAAGNTQSDRMDRLGNQLGERGGEYCSRYPAQSHFLGSTPDSSPAGCCPGHRSGQECHYFQNCY